MGVLTAIEFGGDTCTLVRARAVRAGVHVDVVERLNPAAFPGADAFIDTLRRVRRTLKFPRRASVVLWGMPPGASARDAPVHALLAPLTTAGFRIDRAVRPADALLALSKLRRTAGQGAAAWLAVNRSMVAVAVVKGGTILHAHEFAWDPHFGAVGSQATLLQRYSQVAYLAPELRRATVAAREQGAEVEAIVTCGNLPDLRSLTMPLTQELDLEVETMDSLDGIEASGAARDGAAELAPAIRLATAPMIGKARTVQPARALVPAAAVLIGALGAAYVWYARQPPRSARPAAGRPMASKPSSTKRPVANRPSTNRSAQRPPVARENAPQSQAPRPVPPLSEPARPSTSAPAQQTRAAKPETTPPAAPTKTVPVPASVPAPRPAATAEPRSTPELLKDPLPRVNTILVSADRQVALVDGRVVAVGDKVGQRVVSRIEARSVVFREPSGLQIRIGLGGRFLGVVKGRR